MASMCTRLLCSVARGGRLKRAVCGLESKRLLSLSSFTHNGGDPSRGMPYTTNFDAARMSHTADPIPTYRVMDKAGEVIDADQDPNLSNELLVDMYQKMVTLTIMDARLERAHGAGLISFYMKCNGEEATHFGSAAALDDKDMVYAQYREAGVLMARGFTMDQFVDQCFSNRLDIGRGRQMPVHYGSKELDYQFISSPLATQMPQAPGYAYGLKLAGSKNCVIVYFGDGAAQEGDAHASMNFAATLRCPMIFFCRNNGYAISTPVEEQYAGDGIASRGIGYGIEAVRVDGNDVLAVYNATKYAREVVMREKRPVLVEAMTYRLGSHSTSDDQNKYQDMSQVKGWEEEYHPVLRLKGYIEGKGLWSEDKEKELREMVKKGLERSIDRAKVEKKPNLNYLFVDVYDKVHPRLDRQRQEMWEVVERHREQYPLHLYDQ